MNLGKILFRKWTGTASADSAPATSAPAPEVGGQADRLSELPGNVVSFPLRADWPGGAESDGPHSPAPGPDEIRFKGLISAPELSRFFGTDFFAYGRHNGARCRNREALEQGRQERITQFQGAVATLIGRKQAKLDRLGIEILAIEGISPVTSAQLRLAGEHLERDIRVLTEQIELAGAGNGWVREALHGYETGFARGLRESLEFDLLVG
jgi:hypothetical protein